MQWLRSILFTIWAYGLVLVLGILFMPALYDAARRDAFRDSHLGEDGALGIALDCGHQDRAARA